MADQSRLTWALVLSVLLHGLVLSLFPIMRRSRLEFPKPPAFLDVDLVQLPRARPVPAAPAPAAPVLPPIPVPQQQIVSPPDAGEETEPQETRLLSDRNNTVKEERIHHGEPAAGNPETERQAPPHQRASAEAGRAQPAPKTRAEQSRAHTQLAALPKLDQLLPRAGDVIRDGLVQSQEATPAAAPAQEAIHQRRNLLRHGDPWRRSGLGGFLDFLPTVREGDITLLNTKADLFAPFVRRVAVRVFENFQILLRRSANSGSVQSAQEFATIEAVMDKQGQLVAMHTKDRSLNGAFVVDRNLRSACREGFFDRNPPPGAEANDGNIHFLLDARVSLQVDPRRGLVGYTLFQAGLL
ncbi:MAG: hypothetical protein ACE5I7_08680 [Candidatus Binatia bacterium]